MRFITMMGTAALSMTAATLAQTTINEVRTGAGNAEYIELKGTPALHWPDSPSSFSATVPRSPRVASSSGSTALQRLM